MSEHPRAKATDSGHGGLQILVEAGPARFVADEPVSEGGLDLGPTPHDLVAAGLAACTSLTLRLYAKRKGWALGAVQVSVTHSRHASETPHDRFDRSIEIGGDLDDAQRARLMEIADMCPVHRMLVAGSSIVTTAIAPVGA
jgi:putative redox protein